MRTVIAGLALAALMCGAAHAEKRLFIIASHPDGYGVDTCLANGAPCGHAVADSYCRSHDFAQAVSFRRVDPDDITAAIPADDAGSCQGSNCDHYVAIECSR